MVKQMPHSLEAEQSLLGNMMVYANSARTVKESGIDVQDFYLEQNQKVYRAISDLQAENKPIDLTTVSTRLNEMGLLDAVGGYNYLTTLTDAAVTSANIKTYIDLILDKSYMRNLILASQKIAEEGLEGQSDANEYLDEAERKILAVTRTRRTSEFKKGTDVVNAVIENIVALAASPSKVTGFKTGLMDVDNLTHGFQPGDLIILAARPSMGKTAVALNFATGIAKNNPDKAVAVFSLEMGAEQLVNRMLSAQSGIAGDKIRTGNLTDNDLNILNEGASILKKEKIYIDDTAGIKVSEIFSKCRKLQSEEGLSCIIIDYIQLINGSGRNSESRQQEVSEISRNLKALARELNVPVIALSQLSRGVEQRNDKRPMMSDLRESGALEQDADIVMLLFRESYYNDELKKKVDEVGMESLEIDVAKHRNGATRRIEVVFTPTTNAVFTKAKEYEN